MCPKIDVMERECKKLEFGGDLNKPLTIFDNFLENVREPRVLPFALLEILCRKQNFATVQISLYYGVSSIFF
jgi:hypothetical protein